MTKKQRRAAIEILMCASDPECSSGIIDERNGGYEVIDFDFRQRLADERCAIWADAPWWTDRHAYTLSCLELAQRIADEEWP